MRVALAILLFATLPIQAARPAAPTLDPDRLVWERLSYEASKFIFSSSSEISIERRSAAEVRGALEPAGRGRALEPRGETLALEIESRALGRDSHLVLFFAPDDAMAYQRSQIETGKKKPRQKTYRYTREGVYSVRRYPEKGEEELPSDEWSDALEEYEDFGDGASEGAAITEPSALFYLLATAELDEPGDRLEFLVFSKNHVSPVVLRVEERTRLDVDYREISSGGERTVGGKVEALRISIDPHPPAGGDAEEDFNFLGLEGNLVVYLDPEHRLPLQIEGKVPYAGRVRIKLCEAVVR